MTSDSNVVQMAGVNVAWWTQPNPSWPWDCAEVPTVTGQRQTGHGRLAKGKLAMTDWPKANWPWDWLKQIGCRTGQNKLAIKLVMGLSRKKLDMGLAEDKLATRLAKK